MGFPWWIYPASAVEVDAGVVGGVAQRRGQLVDAVLDVAVRHEGADDAESATQWNSFKIDSFQRVTGPCRTPTALAIKEKTHREKDRISDDEKKIHLSIDSLASFSIP